jgi:SET domain-containing protein
VLMHKKNQGNLVVCLITQKTPNCIAKLIEIENSPRIVLFALKDISNGAKLLFDYGDRRKASILAHPWLAL